MNNICFKLEKMAALKLKIFDVLTEKISVLEFEKWLYNSEEFISQINANSFYFDIISINYKSDKCTSELNELAKKHLGYDYLEILTIKKICSSIIKSETFKETHRILNAMAEDFDCDTDFSILWKFYSLKDSFDLVEECIYDEGTLQIEAKFYSNQAVEIIKKFKSFDELKSELEVDLIPFKSSKTQLKELLKQKLLAFFKKI